MRAFVLAAAFSVCAEAASAQPLPDWAQQREAVGKSALVIGVGDYLNARDLPTPEIDADLVAGVLTDLQFHVRRSATNREAIFDAVEELARDIAPGDIVVIYFSGHGIERNGANYIVPSDATQAEVGEELHVYIDVRDLLAPIENAGAGVVIVVLDACRTDPYPGGFETAQAADEETLPPEAAQADAAPARETAPVQRPVGLAAIDGLPTGVIVQFAAAPGRPAWSLRPGEQASAGSIYTRSLTGAMSAQHRRLSWILDEAVLRVRTLTNQRQQPWRSQSVGGEIMFRPSPSFRAEEEEAWRYAVLESSPETEEGILTSFMAHYPASDFARTARRRVSGLSQGRSNINLASYAPPAGRFADTAYYSGSLRSADTLTSVTAVRFAVADEAIELRSAPNLNARRSRVVGTVDSGEPVKVLSVRRPLTQVIFAQAQPTWAEVMSSDGQVGYIPGVIARQLPQQAARVEYAGTESDAQVADPASLDAAFDGVAQTGRRLVIRVGRAGAADGGRADQVAFLRALRLRHQAITRGVPINNITLSIDADESPDTARIFSLQSEDR